MRRAVDEGIRSSNFPMLRNQGGVGGVGTYWVTLVAGGLIESDSGMLSPRGVALADTFLANRTTPDRASLRRVISGEDIEFGKSVLIDWGRTAHLGAASRRERRLLADALLEPEPHRRMAIAIRATDTPASDSNTFRLLGKHLKLQKDTVAIQMAAVLKVALAFEDLHRDLLYRFDHVRAAGYDRPVSLTSIDFTDRPASLAKRGDALQRALSTHATRLPRSVAEAVHGFSVAVQPTVRAQDDGELALGLIRHHDRVQSGKLDASRQPKAPWATVRRTEIVVAPRYALEERPDKPSRNELTHPYRIEQFAGMLHEAGIRGPTS